MIKNILSIGLLSLGIVPSLTFAETHVTVKGGDVEFRGAVVNAACVVDVGSEDLVVQMGEIRTDEFHGLGSWTDPQAFTLELKDCDSTVSQDVGVTFRGQTDKKDPGVLAVIDGAQSAQGVGLGLFDSQGNQIIPNERPLTFTPIQDGTTSLHFTARYRATSNEVIAGDANTETWFTLTYL